MEFDPTTLSDEDFMRWLVADCQETAYIPQEVLDQAQEQEDEINWQQYVEELKNMKETLVESPSPLPQEKVKMPGSTFCVRLYDCIENEVGARWTGESNCFDIFDIPALLSGMKVRPTTQMSEQSLRTQLLRHGFNKMRAAKSIFFHADNTFYPNNREGAMAMVKNKPKLTTLKSKRTREDSDCYTPTEEANITSLGKHAKTEELLRMRNQLSTQLQFMQDQMLAVDFLLQQSFNF
eukprot:TRINITY_DN14073_c0_g1_i1.p2 TRINITY_DN14073_c0_g1~~TRINITY_DN14073_c0_g1_i1.p2  ORF type:complete len:236 (-),score=32.88 TRINITY_DN14073_c0_g1_i1:1625-2332(-)